MSAATLSTSGMEVRRGGRATSVADAERPRSSVCTSKTSATATRAGDLDAAGLDRKTQAASH